MSHFESVAQIKKEFKREIAALSEKGFIFKFSSKNYSFGKTFNFSVTKISEDETMEKDFHYNSNDSIFFDVDEKESYLIKLFSMMHEYSNTKHIEDEKYVNMRNNIIPILTTFVMHDDFSNNVLLSSVIEAFPINYNGRFPLKDFMLSKVDEHSITSCGIYGDGSVFVNFKSSEKSPVIIFDEAADAIAAIVSEDISGVVEKAYKSMDDYTYQNRSNLIQFAQPYYFAKEDFLVTIGQNHGTESGYFLLDYFIDDKTVREEKKGNTYFVNEFKEEYNKLKQEEGTGPALTFSPA